MKVTYLGTTVLLFDDGTDQLMFDAHFTRPSMIHMVGGKIRTDRALVDKIIKNYEIDRLKGIFVSHSHYDHVLDAPYLAEKTGANIYGSNSALNVARGGGIPENRLFSFAKSKEYKIGGFEVTVIPSIHSKAHWYNNDLGKTIDKPVVQPVSKRSYKEGGSFDFLVKNGGKTFLIRPSFNFIEGQLDGIKADVLFLGITGLSKADENFRNKFFAETIEKVEPKLVIPLHWDNFMKPLNKLSYMFPSIIEKTDLAMFRLAQNCAENNVGCVVQLPLTTIEL